MVIMRCNLVTLTLLLLSFSEAGPILYSVNVRSSGEDELVTVDAATGTVVTIGSLGPSVQLEFPNLSIAFSTNVQSI
jgi:hypothetical protein